MHTIPELVRRSPAPAAEDRADSLPRCLHLTTACMTTPRQHQEARIGRQPASPPSNRRSPHVLSVSLAYARSTPQLTLVAIQPRASSSSATRRGRIWLGLHHKSRTDLQQKLRTKSFQPQSHDERRLDNRTSAHGSLIQIRRGGVGRQRRDVGDRHHRWQTTAPSNTSHNCVNRELANERLAETL